MRLPFSSRPVFVAFLALSALLATAPAFAADEIAASKSLTVQTSGIRAGKPGESYFNIEGKNNGEGKYASFGVLSFPSKALAGSDLKTAGLSLKLVQSVARFTKDGKINIYLVSGTSDLTTLKFDPSGTEGLGGQFATKQSLGSATFKKADTGHADTIALTLTPDVRSELAHAVAKGTDIVLLVLPADDDVAATYLGTGQEDAAKRPTLKLVATP